jgi:hypothetical protein
MICSCRGHVLRLAEQVEVNTRARNAAFTLDSALARAQKQEEACLSAAKSSRSRSCCVATSIRKALSHPPLCSPCSAKVCGCRSSRRVTGHAPPLPLQTSTRRARTPLPAAGVDAGGRQTSATPSTERPLTSRYQPLSFTQRVRDASRVSTSQSDAGVSSQTSTGPRMLSQEGWRRVIFGFVFRGHTDVAVKCTWGKASS